MGKFRPTRAWWSISPVAARMRRWRRPRAAAKSVPAAPKLALVSVPAAAVPATAVAPAPALTEKPAEFTFVEPKYSVKDDKANQPAEKAEEAAGRLVDQTA